MTCVVYWLFDDRCVCVWRHGYVGISTEADARLKRHRLRAGTRKSAVGVPAIFNHKILFTGTVDGCVALEEKLRPHKNIGWNRAIGGREPWLNYKHDDEMRAKLSTIASNRKRKPHSPETRAKMKAAALLRYTDPSQYAATVAHLKSLTFDRSGAANGHFGKPHSEEAKRKIRDGVEARGGVLGSRNPHFGKKHSEATKQIMRKQKLKSVCKNGHSKEPGKPCRECQRIWAREAYHRHKGGPP